MNDRLDELLCDESSSSSFLRSSSSQTLSVGRTTTTTTTITNAKTAAKKHKSKQLPLAIGIIKKKFKKFTKNGTLAVPTQKTSKNKHEQQHRNTTSAAGGDPGRSVVMEAFHGQIGSLDNQIESIQSANKDIQAMTERITFAVLTSKEEKVLDNRICSLVGTTNQTAQSIRTTLRLIQEETKQLQLQQQQGEAGQAVAVTVLAPSDIQVRENMYSLTSRKFMEELRLYQNAQKDYKEKTTNKFKRQIQYHINKKSDTAATTTTTTTTITDEQVEAFLQNGEIDRDTLFREMILDNTNGNKINQQILSIHRAVSHKHNAVLQLEQSVAMIHQMFLDFALLTEEQGLLLDRIDYQIQQTNDYVEQGNEELYESRQLQKKIRKKKLITLAITAGVVVVVVLVVVL